MKSTPAPLLSFIVLFGLLSACGGSAPDGTPPDLTPDASVSHPDAPATPSDDHDAGRPPPAPGTAGAGGSTPSTAAASLGSLCARSEDCGSGHCTDGVCCDTACDGACESCALTGKLGVCAPVESASDDRCDGASTCDAKGACRKALSWSCVSGTDCASGNCVDGVCCGTSTCGTCQSCGLPDSLGRCAPVSPRTEDGDSACAGNMTCGELGTCVRKNGQSCTASGDCASRQCVDGVCCESACDDGCYACNLAGKEGRCAPLARIEDPAAATSCAGSRYCDIGSDGAPVCLSKLADGVPCTFALQCESGVCGTYYLDADNDGYGAQAVTTCGSHPPVGAAAVGGDCCDSADNVHPGVTEFSKVANACGGFDFNCDGREERVAPSVLPCGGVGQAIVILLGGTDTRVGCR
jgi:hypothetical protein